MRRRGPRVTLRAAVAVMLAIAPAGCLARPPTSVAEDDAFRLELFAPSAGFEAGQPVIVSARLTYRGPAAAVDAFGSGSGPVLFGLTQLDGPFDPGGGGDASCARYEFRRGEPQEVAYRKSGGWSAEDPLAEAYRAFFDDPLVHLPNGVYEFTAAIELSIGECGPADAFHGLRTAIRIVVGGQVGPIEEPRGADL